MESVGHGGIKSVHTPAASRKIRKAVTSISTSTEHSSGVATHITSKAIADQTIG